MKRKSASFYLKKVADVLRREQAISDKRGGNHIGHTHKSVEDINERCFTGPVASPEDQNPRAHGNITVTEVCECGAERDVNINGNHIEYGEWRMPGSEDNEQEWNSWGDDYDVF